MNALLVVLPSILTKTENMGQCSLMMLSSTGLPTIEPKMCCSYFQCLKTGCEFILEKLTCYLVEFANCKL